MKRKTKGSKRAPSSKDAALYNEASGVAKKGAKR